MFRNLVAAVGITALLSASGCEIGFGYKSHRANTIAQTYISHDAYPVEICHLSTYDGIDNTFAWDLTGDGYVDEKVEAIGPFAGPMDVDDLVDYMQQNPTTYWDHEVSNEIWSSEQLIHTNNTGHMGYWEQEDISEACGFVWGSNADYYYDDHDYYYDEYYEECWDDYWQEWYDC